MDSRGDAIEPVDLRALAERSAADGPVWTHGRPDGNLNVNLVVWGEGEGVAAHSNEEMDVLLVGVAGVGVVEVDGSVHTLRAGQAVVIPKGCRRAIRGTAGRFAYLTCHRRRGGLWPRRDSHPG